MTTVMWFRRDLRLRDQPALNAAAAEGDVVPLLVIDPAQFDAAGAVPRAHFAATVRALDESLGHRLHLRFGDPLVEVPATVREFAATAVHASADFSPFGSARDAAVREALAETPLVFTGSPYAVAPGRVVKADGTPFKVYTPFYRGWMAHGWRKPAPQTEVRFVDAGRGQRLAFNALPQLSTVPIGEEAALQRWHEFLERGLGGYEELRDRPDLDATTRLSAALRVGAIHPRTLLADLGDEPDHEKLRREIAWREFCADLLWHNPHTTHSSLVPRFDAMRWDSGDLAEQRFLAWTSGLTGYPMVDAGIRELLTTGLMHNRVRMIVASFLIKHLHIDWRRGERWFKERLLDSDTASNALNWQWVAGCGADASPFVRVFNPVTQGYKFDPDGDYVRRFVPELAHLPGASVHEPWVAAAGYAHGYPQRIIDLATERAEALARFEDVRA